MREHLSDLKLLIYPQGYPILCPTFVFANRQKGRDMCPLLDPYRRRLIDLDPGGFEINPRRFAPILYNKLNLRNLGKKSRWLTLDTPLGHSSTQPIYNGLNKGAFNSSKPFTYLPF